MADSKHNVPLHDLPVDYITDKIPPGWYVGCKLSLKKYMELCEDWKQMKGLNDDMKAQVAACRFRLKGPARELVDANRALKRGPPTAENAQGEVLEAYNNEWKNFFQTLKDNYGERDQKLSEERYEEFFTYYRKRSETVQEYTSEFNRRYTRAHEEKIDLGDRVKGYWYLRQGRFSEEQKRWILTPIRNDWSKFTEMQQSALEMPAAISGSAHYTEKDDSGIFWGQQSSDTHWSSGPSSAYNDYHSSVPCADCAEWETCYNEVYQALDEWGLTDPAAWEEDDYEDCSEAYWNDDDWETCYEEDEEDY